MPDDDVSSSSSSPKIDPAKVNFPSATSSDGDSSRSQEASKPARPARPSMDEKGSRSGAVAIFLILIGWVVILGALGAVYLGHLPVPSHSHDKYDEAIATQNTMIQELEQRLRTLAGASGIDPNGLESGRVDALVEPDVDAELSVPEEAQGADSMPVHPIPNPPSEEGVVLDGNVSDKVVTDLPFSPEDASSPPLSADASLAPPLLLDPLLEGDLEGVMPPLKGEEVPSAPLIAPSAPVAPAEPTLAPPPSIDMPKPTLDDRQPAGEEYHESALPIRSYELATFEHDAVTAGIADVSERTASLQEKLDKLDKVVASVQAREAISDQIVTSIYLREAVLMAKPFEVEVVYLGQLAKNDPYLFEQLKILSPLSSKGVASKNGLIARYEETAAKALGHYRTEASGEEGSALDKVTALFSKMITVQKVGVDVKGDQTPDVLARATHYIDAEDIPAALKEIGALTGQSASLFTSWKEDASAYVSAIVASENIFDHLTRASYGKHANAGL